MDLDQLKQAWNQNKLINGFDIIEREELLEIINIEEEIQKSFFHSRSYSFIIVHVFLVFLFQSC